MPNFFIVSPIYILLLGTVDIGYSDILDIMIYWI